MTETATPTEGTVEHSLRQLPAFTGLYTTVGLGTMGGCPFMLLSPAIAEKTYNEPVESDYEKGLEMVRKNVGRCFEAYAVYKARLMTYPAHNSRVGLNAILVFNGEYLRLMGTLGELHDAGRIALLSAIQVLTENETMLSEAELTKIRAEQMNQSTPFHPDVMAQVDASLFREFSYGE